MRKRNILNRRIYVSLIVLLMIGLTGLYMAHQVNAADETKTNQTGEEVQATESGLTNSKLEGLETTTVQKDETVYVNLNHNGTVSKINIVNYFHVNGDGEYMDYGNYDSIKNLTNEVEPILKDNSIRWQLTGSTEEFFYQGSLKSGELPWNFEIQYTLNGNVIEPEALTGVEGELGILIDVKVNEEAHEYFRKNYMMQITVPLNMKHCTLLSAPGAIQMIAGSTKNLAYTVLPETSQSIGIKADVRDFSMQGIDLTMMAADMSAYIQTEEITDGFGEMSTGIEELADGTAKLRDGISELSTGLLTLSDGMKELSDNTPLLSEGMKEFDEGIKALSENLNNISSGSSLMEAGLLSMVDHGGQLSTGYKEIANGMSTLLTMKEELTAIAGEMAQSKDPVVAQTAQALVSQMEGISQLLASLENLNYNLDQYMQGVKQTAGNYSEINSGITALAGGAGDLAGGFQEIKRGNNEVYMAISDLGDGLEQISNATALIPEQTQQLVDGQWQMKDGIEEASMTIEELTGASKDSKNKTVSFAAPGKITPNSVQFILRTPAIEKRTEHIVEAEEEQDTKNFWDRLFDLFS
ncbi:hypothetical protein I5677_03705 [Mobilitalea sibirica]|uniref:X-X-X-Leu-X-X-Gly heptad repeat protein n=1 Tax=Mobilitalea sibirica TaxID=1462919 RepID=A0A8J7HAJ5_9FIRM|nr:hypothetical protein [Mobilitalea sibirica]MBH1940001.1 hypothetical protein [Mobilitalea sibirica]